jgi:hypothetical protein
MRAESWPDRSVDRGIVARVKPGTDKRRVSRCEVVESAVHCSLSTQSGIPVRFVSALHSPARQHLMEAQTSHKPSAEVRGNSRPEEIDGSWR